jgi:hypothetical protein
MKLKTQFSMPLAIGAECTRMERRRCVTCRAIPIAKSEEDDGLPHAGERFYYLLTECSTWCSNAFAWSRPHRASAVKNYIPKAHRT